MVLPVVNPSDGRIVAEAVRRTELQNLALDLTELEKYRDYYNGDQLLVFGTEKFKDTFGDLFEGFRDNWCDVVVDAVERKLQIVGFNFSPSTDLDLTDLEKKIWDIFLRNGIEEQQSDLHNGILVEGRGYVIVWPDPELGAKIDWNPAQLVRVRYDEDDWRKPLWAVKRWRTPSGEVRVTFYYPDRIEKYTDGGPDQTEPTATGKRATIPNATSSLSLIRRDVEGEPWPLPNPFGEVPVVEFDNPKHSEIYNVIPQQDAINYTLITQLIAGEYQAFRQLIINTANDQPEGGWISGPGNVWHFKPEMGPDDRPYPFDVVQTQAYDPGVYVKVIEMYLQHIALTSSTPVRYFFHSTRGGRGDAPSGESLRVEDQPLIDKVTKRQNRYSNPWYQVGRLVAKALNQTATIPYGGPVWRAPEYDYRMTLINEAIGLKTLGVPLTFIIRKLGLSPEEIGFVEAELAKNPPVEQQPAPQPPA